MWWVTIRKKFDRNFLRYLNYCHLYKCFLVYYLWRKNIFKFHRVSCLQILQSSYSVGLCPFEGVCLRWLKNEYSNFDHWEIFHLNKRYYKKSSTRKFLICDLKLLYFYILICIQRTILWREEAFHFIIH